MSYARGVLMRRLGLKTGDRVLVVVAARNEASALLRGLRPTAEPPDEWVLFRAGPETDLIVSGVGKANAAGAVARVLDPGVHGAVLSIGIGGAMGPGALAIGTAVGGEASVFGDEGVAGPEQFRSLSEIGFPPVPGVGDAPAGDAAPCDPDLLEALRAIGVCERTGRIATVSACSGTDAGAAAVAGRTGAIVEAMEGAAVGLVAARLGVAFAEVRVISNTTGDRDRQVWDIPRAMTGLEGIGRALSGVGAVADGDPVGS